MKSDINAFWLNFPERLIGRHISQKRQKKDYFDFVLIHKAQPGMRQFILKDVCRIIVSLV